jgi:hypothetical protein
MGVYADELPKTLATSGKNRVVGDLLALTLDQIRIIWASLGENAKIFARLAGCLTRGVEQCCQHRDNYPAIDI